MADQVPERLDMPWGYILFGLNEISIISTVEDPPKIRCASVAGLSLGAMSFGRLRADGQQVEMVLIQGKQDERTRDLPPSDPKTYAAEFTVHMNNGGDQDANMVRVLEARHDGIRFDVPISTPSL